MKMIDIKQLRQTIAAAPAAGDAATVTRNFLEQIAAELSAGRAAQAQLAQQRGIGASGSAEGVQP